MRIGDTYHRLVKTTPKPSATKNSNGELVGPPPPPPLLELEADAAEDVVEEGMKEAKEDDMVLVAALDMLLPMLLTALDILMRSSNC